MDAAVEAGIPAAAVQRALAVERLDPSPRPHVGDRLVGAAVIAVDIEVPGSPPDRLARMDAWLVDGHHLRRDRLHDGRGCGPSAVESSGSPAAGTTVAGVATASTIVLAVVAGPLVLAATPIGLAAVVGLAARSRSRTNAVTLEVDRVVDALNEPVPPTGLRTDIARRAIGRTKSACYAPKC